MKCFRCWSLLVSIFSGCGILGPNHKHHPSAMCTLMEVASIPWECVASFLGAPDILYLRVVVSYLNEANLYGTWGPLLFFLMQNQPANRINYAFDW